MKLIRNKVVTQVCNPFPDRLREVEVSDQVRNRCRDKMTNEIWNPIWSQVTIYLWMQCYEVWNLKYEINYK
jgi:hypothetical protein